MNLTVTLSQTEISVPPGEQVLLEVTVRNTSTVVDRFTVEVLGEAAQWGSVEPPNIVLNPASDGSVFIRFDIPREAGVSVGQLPFAVKVTSQEDPEGSVVEEGLLVVGRFADVAAELVPRTARGVRRTRHEVAVDNRGNARLSLELEAKDPDGVLAFRIDPPNLVVEPDAAAFARVRVRTRGFLRGAPRTHPFRVTASTPDGIQHLDGVMLQEPLLPPWSLRALGAVVAGALVLALLWSVLLKPQVRSVAADAVAAPLARTNEAVNRVGAAVGQNPGLPTNGNDVVEGQSSTATTATSAPAGAASLIATTFGSPFDHRLAVDGTGVVQDSFAIDHDKLFSLTDVVLENPDGDSGTITLLRGDEILFRETLANFRSADYHFVAPILFDEGTRIVLRVDCRNTGPNCTAASQLSGFLKSKSVS